MPAVFAPARVGELIDTVASTRRLYVSPAGNNSTARAGDPSRPYLTYAAAAAAVTHGGTIVLQPGAYTSSIVLPSRLTSSISSIQRTSNVVSVVTAAAHNLVAGQAVRVICSNGTLCGEFTVATAADTTHFTFAQRGSDMGSPVTSGTVMGRCCLEIEQGAVIDYAGTDVEEDYSNAAITSSSDFWCSITGPTSVIRCSDGCGIAIHERNASKLDVLVQRIEVATVRSRRLPAVYVMGTSLVVDIEVLGDIVNGAYDGVWDNGTLRLNVRAKRILARDNAFEQATAVANSYTVIEAQVFQSFGANPAINFSSLASGHTTLVLAGLICNDDSGPVVTGGGGGDGAVLMQLAGNGAELRVDADEIRSTTGPAITSNDSWTGLHVRANHIKSSALLAADGYAMYGVVGGTARLYGNPRLESGSDVTALTFGDGTAFTIVGSCHGAKPLGVDATVQCGIFTEDATNG